MMTRRGFLAVLGGLPFVGKLIPQPQAIEFKWSYYGGPPLYPTPVPFPRFDPRIHAIAGRGYMHVGDHWYMFTKDSVYEIRDVERPRLTFAEWDRKYQG